MAAEARTRLRIYLAWLGQANVQKQRLGDDHISAAGTHVGRGHKFTAAGVVMPLQAAMGDVEHGS